jgi:hypothetical protein
MNCREALEPIRDMPRIADVRLAIGATHDLIAQGGAIFSPCERYRYLLWRIWNPALPFWSFGMLNPSTADQLIDSVLISPADDGDKGVSIEVTGRLNSMLALATGQTLKANYSVSVGAGEGNCALPRFLKVAV